MNTLPNSCHGGCHFSKQTTEDCAKIRDCDEQIRQTNGSSAMVTKAQLQDETELKKPTSLFSSNAGKGAGNKTIMHARMKREQGNKDNGAESQRHVSAEQQHTRGRYKHCDTLERFKYPWGVAVSSNGDVAVAEWGRNCITIIDSQGEHKTSFGGKEKAKIQLQNPCGVLFTDGNQHLLVTDSTRVLKYTQQGKLVKSVGGKGHGQRQFDLAAGLSIHPHNNWIYVADSNNHRIQVLNSDLSFRNTFGGRGSERGKFYLPWDVAFDSKGMVYVVEGNCRIQKFTPDGRFVTAFGKKGSGPGEIRRPASIAIDNDDMIHITDLYNNCISMYTTSGEFVCSYGNHNNGSAESFNGPCGITVSNNGTLYVSDCWNDRVKIFRY